MSSKICYLSRLAAGEAAEVVGIGRRASIPVDRRSGQRQEHDRRVTGLVNAPSKLSSFPRVPRSIRPIETPVTVAPFASVLILCVTPICTRSASVADTASMLLLIDALDEALGCTGTKTPPALLSSVETCRRKSGSWSQPATLRGCLTTTMASNSSTSSRTRRRRSMMSRTRSRIG